MIKFIELTYVNGDKFYLDINDIRHFIWYEGQSCTDVHTYSKGGAEFCIRETLAEIMAKIREVQND